MSSSRSAAKGKGKAVLHPSQIQVRGVDDSPLWNHVKVTGGASVEVAIGIGCATTATRRPEVKGTSPPSVPVAFSLDRLAGYWWQKSSKVPYFQGQQNHANMRCVVLEIF
ncbi:hypothetical protein RJ639_032125 [Escallonia herrerae]|uniref:Uncharacterized protein n=1 Tax=Escallonia herrerae TaxID=1293975 RepID=A0AA88XFW0_9ASTE|nr:hypothetical protein RJ639_032125 [Escallonia herrerae]